MFEAVQIRISGHSGIMGDALMYTIQNPPTSSMKSKSEMQWTPYTAATSGILTFAAGCPLTFLTDFSKVMIVALKSFADAISHGSAIFGGHPRSLRFLREFILLISEISHDVLIRCDYRQVRQWIDDGLLD